MKSYVFRIFHLQSLSTEIQLSRQNNSTIIALLENKTKRTQVTAAVGERYVDSSPEEEAASQKCSTSVKLFVLLITSYDFLS